jgi:mannose-6-phosphate isomerase-like protein (cupin superfamily)
MNPRVLRLGKGFRVAFGNKRSQAAEIVLGVGDSEGGPANRHRGSDQWLYVVSGTGTATVEGKSHALRARTLVLIERGQAHEIRNTGPRPLRTLNLYVPPRVPCKRRPVTTRSQLTDHRPTNCPSPNSIIRIPLG